MNDGSFLLNVQSKGLGSDIVVFGKGTTSDAANFSPHSIKFVEENFAFNLENVVLTPTFRACPLARNEFGWPTVSQEAHA